MIKAIIRHSDMTMSSASLQHNKKFMPKLLFQLLKKLLMDTMVQCSLMDKQEAVRLTLWLEVWLKEI